MKHKKGHKITWYYESGFIAECDRKKCIINKIAKKIRKRKKN